MASSLAGPRPDPFAPSTDPGLFVPTLGHADCLARLRQAIRRGPGLAVVTGGAGSGKTIMAAALVRDILADQAAGVAGGDQDGGLAGGETFVVGTIPDPTLCRTDVQFLRAILGQFGVPAGGRTGLDLLTRFQRALVGDTGDGIPATGTLAQTPLLVIDDAASLAGSHFEIIRGLLAFGDVAGPRAPRVVLLGRPELTDKVGRKRNLANRVTMSHALNPLNEQDTVALLSRRMTVAGVIGDGASPRFAPAAMVAIAERTGGIPAAILRAASATLDLATRSGRAVIEASTVAAVLPAPATGTDLVLSGLGSAGTPPVGGALQTRLAFVVPADIEGTAPVQGDGQ